MKPPVANLSHFYLAWIPTLQKHKQIFKFMILRSLPTWAFAGSRPERMISVHKALLKFYVPNFENNLFSPTHSDLICSAGTISRPARNLNMAVHFAVYPWGDKASVFKCFMHSGSCLNGSSQTCWVQGFSLNADSGKPCIGLLIPWLQSWDRFPLNAKCGLPRIKVGKMALDKL